jgi:hypothetical protein
VAELKRLAEELAVIKMIVFWPSTTSPSPLSVGTITPAETQPRERTFRKRLCDARRVLLDAASNPRKIFRASFRLCGRAEIEMPIWTSIHAKAALHLLFPCEVGCVTA